MKNRIQTNTFKIAFIAISLIGMASCTDTKKPENTKVVAEEHNDTKFDNTSKEKDSQFLVDAAEINLEEIQLGQLAQQNSNMSDIKELGKMMEKEHSKSLVSLTALAGEKMIAIPTTITNEAKDAYDKLTKKLDADFNYEYCEMMVKGHKAAISIFEKATIECTDSDIRYWAFETLPNLRKHLDHAITCQKKFEKIK